MYYLSSAPVQYSGNPRCQYCGVFRGGVDGTHPLLNVPGLPGAQLIRQRSCVALGQFQGDWILGTQPMRTSLHT